MMEIKIKSKLTQSQLMIFFLQFAEMAILDYVLRFNQEKSKGHQSGCYLNFMSIKTICNDVFMTLTTT